MEDALLLAPMGKDESRREAQEPVRSRKVSSPPVSHAGTWHTAPVPSGEMVWAPGVRQRLVDALGVTPEEVEDIVVLVTALHDLGKAYPNFQIKSERFAAELARFGLPLKTYGEDIPARHRKHSRNRAVAEIQRFCTSFMRWRGCSALGDN